MLICVSHEGVADGVQQLNCVLTDTATKPGSESRPIAVAFDEQNKTLTAQDGGHSYTFMNVTISNVTISGQADNVTLGIDRSALAIVWQQYQGSEVATEFGHCDVPKAQ